MYFKREAYVSAAFDKTVGMGSRSNFKQKMLILHWFYFHPLQHCGSKLHTRKNKEINLLPHSM